MVRILCQANKECLRWESNVARRRIYLARYLQPLLSYTCAMLMLCAQKKVNIVAEILYFQAA